ncbi:MAG: ATP-binding protein [Thermoleophilia bacterium]
MRGLTAESTPNSANTGPASLQVFRYRVGSETVETVIGPPSPCLPHAVLAAHAADALGSRTFMFYTLSDDGAFDADELCFVPAGDHCDILSIHSHHWHRRRGDIRRDLIDILTELAAAIACGSLVILDGEELGDHTAPGDELVRIPIDDTQSLARAREVADFAMCGCDVPPHVRRQTVLAISEAATNILVHGGGHGHMTVRLLDDRLRFVVDDSGTGLNFLSWRDGPRVDSSPSMGYGFKIILESFDTVGLHSGSSGTTLILDRITD